MTSKKYLTRDTTSFLDAINLASDGTNDKTELTDGWFISYTDEDADNPSPIVKAAIRDNNLYILDEEFQSMWSLQEITIVKETDEDNVFYITDGRNNIEAIIYLNKKFRTRLK